MYLTDVDAHGLSVPVSVTEEGKFTAQLGDDVYVQDTLWQLRSMVKDAVLASRIEPIPFFNEFGRSGVIRGFHGGTKEVLVTWDDDGSKGKLSHHARILLGSETQNTLVTELREVAEVVEKGQARLDELRQGAQKAGEVLNKALGENLLAHNRHWPEETS